VHRDLGFLDYTGCVATGQVHHQVEQSRCQGFEQVDRFVLGVFDEQLGEVGVVDGGREVIVDGSFVAVDPHGCVDIKVLAILPFEVENPVIGKDPQTGEADFVLHGLTLLPFTKSRNNTDGVCRGQNIVHAHTPELALQQHGG